jgi:hypothetical protein
MENNEIKCLSCDKIIKSFNLKRHSDSEKHKINVEKKVNKMKSRVK